jgi:hypothetical protein
MRMPFRRGISWYLIFAMFLLGMAPAVQASFSPSEALDISKIDRDGDIAKIQKVLEKKLIRDRLEKLGFSAEEVRARIAGMTDAQVHQLANRLDQLNVGGDGLEFVVAVLIIAILVVILLHLTGHRVIVK